MHIPHMSLGDGLSPFLAVQLRIPRVHQVDIAVVAHRQVFYLQALTPEVEHGKVAHGTLSLSALRSQHDILRTVAQANQREMRTADGHAERLASTLSHPDGRVVRIVNPIDTGADICRHTIGEMGACLLKGLVGKRCAVCCLSINHDVQAV